MTINNRLISNKLTIKTDKTQFILFNRHKPISYPLMPIIIDNDIVEVEQIRFSGVIANRHLYWYSYIQYVRNKTANFFDLVYSTRSHFNRGAIYYSLVHSNMTYCLTGQGGVSSTSRNPLIAIQKKTAISGLKTTDHTNDSFIT